MAVAGTTPITPFDSTSTATSYTTASGTPIAGEPVVVWVSNRKTTTADTPTLAGTNGWNVTWTQLDTLTTTGSALSRLTAFIGIPSSGVAGTLTADFSGASQVQCSIIAVSFSGADTSSGQGIVQHLTDGAASGTNTVTLAAFGSANNATAMGCVARGTPSAFTPEEAYTGYSVSGGINGTGAEWLATSDTTPSATWTSSTNWAAIAVEIAAASAAPDKTPHTRRPQLAPILAQ